MIVILHYSALYKDCKCPITTSHVGSSQVWSRFLRYSFGNETKETKGTTEVFFFSNVPVKRNFLSSNRLTYYLLLSRRLLDDAANPFKKWGRFIGQNRRSRHAANADAPRHAAYVRPLILVNYTGTSPAPLFIIIFSFSFF